MISRGGKPPRHTEARKAGRHAGVGCRQSWRTSEELEPSGAGELLAQRLAADPHDSPAGCGLHGGWAPLVSRLPGSRHLPTPDGPHL